MTPEIEMLKVRGELYAVLSNLFMRPPTRTFEKDFREGILPFLLKIRDIAKGEEWDESIEAGISLLEKWSFNSKGNVGTEFTKLFRGLRKTGIPPPYESVYAGEEQVMGDVSDSVKSFYKEAGLKLADSFQGEPPDHIGFEIFFLGYLCNKELEDDNTKKIKARFMQEHLMRWAVPFLRKVQQSGSEFYGGVSMITEGILRMESRECAQKV
ncbi:MAG: molecular chaperone TorD family protein [Candidatus Aenigmarchaeota archaeon]|nr:molecular chaperone TorD family protein [Candidatus Aenigmarchaeota archaeon]